MNKDRMIDRIGDYLIPHTNDYIFDELSESCLERAGLADILTGVPVPIRKTELTGLTNVKIAHNMAVIIGCNINFQYRDSYLEYIRHSFGKDFAKPLINEGIKSAAQGDFDYACICFRGALLIDPESKDALYCYGRACRDSYDAGEGEEYVGRYKAEALEAFEKLTLSAPDFDMGFYYLGYLYLNLGLYLKAKLTWEEFMKLAASDNGDSTKQREEISEWLRKLDEPVKIEAAYNKVLSGRFEQGIEELSPYVKDSRFDEWWPLWYYLGVAYSHTGDKVRAEESFRRVLEISPSNTEAMEELVSLYEAAGDEERREKYAEKIKLVKKNREEEKAERNKGLS